MSKPRKPSPPKEREQLNIRLRPGERAQLQEEADIAQRKLSDWARVSLLETRRRRLQDGR